ncbi:hypothetical protein [Sphingobacterium sp. 2149]|uniref:hypothetical protein n=1 Tax=Sphingobacterium sp. 2149 TaxID=2817763 RepID=UPI00285697F9|nr:hypothetical protein [Sphingobacterium sp. 2149]MDR6733471.1 hypothetical protein [Sphingobacterium sp. 2149]
MKEKIIDHLSTLIANNVIGDIQYHNRFNGFIGELDFKEYMILNKPENSYLDGGIFVPTKQGESYLDKPIYFTVTNELNGSYNEIYSRISRVNCKALYILEWNIDKIEDWKEIDILGVGKKIFVPELNVSKYVNEEFVSSSLDEFLREFNKKAHKYTDSVPLQVKKHFIDIIIRFDLNNLLDLYVQRFVFDGLLGLHHERGIPTDIDQIILSYKTRQYFFVEIKEKDLSKRPPIGFGMDIPRIQFFRSLKATVGFETFYIVKQINDQTSREFVNWRAISMSNFIKNCNQQPVEGGTGMRSIGSSNPTLICPEEFFRTYS